MGLKGSCSDESFEHDHVASWQHERDKRAQQQRLEGNVQWIPILMSEDLKFHNDFSAFGNDEALYFCFGGIPEVRAADLEPKAWDASGSLASYAAGSQIAAYREFRRSNERQRRGRKKKGQIEAEFGPPAPQVEIAPLRDALNLEPIDPKTYKAMLRMVRDETLHYHCWGTGGGGRGQWKKVPTATKIKISEGILPAELLDCDDGTEGIMQTEPISELKTAYEMERMTVNTHPALARALVKLLAAGHKDKVRELMIQSIPQIVRKFEEVTGRKVVGLSIHWDSDLPHWNLWHTGLERVIYNKGKGADRTRYRRTAINLNSSGPGLRAWRRAQLALERLGKPTCPATIIELNKAEQKAMEDQGRLPGDWQINDAADAVLEELLSQSGYKNLVDQGFSEYVENEEKRYEAGLAGKVSRMERHAMAAQIRILQVIANERGAELEASKDAAEANGVIRHLVTEFLVYLSQQPWLLEPLKKVPVIKDILLKLALFLNVQLELSPPDVAQDLVAPAIAKERPPVPKAKPANKNGPSLEM